MSRTGFSFSNRESTDLNQQFTLRIKKGTPLDKIIRALLSEDRPLTNSQLAEIGGQSQWGYMGQWIFKMTDNVTLIKDWGANAQTITYRDPNPPTPISVGIDVQTTSNGAGLAPATSGHAPAKPNVDAMTWPQMPPVPEGLGDKFRKPVYYDTMKAMVMLGKAIALAGPPGVGKDTAIEQLAADTGHPLVTVGGEGGLRKRDLVGTMEMIQGSTTFRVAEFAAAVVHGWWASITEVNAAEPDVLLLINAILATPYIININGKAYPVHPNFRLFVSYNPGLTGTKPLPQSFKDRFYSVQTPFLRSDQMRSLLEAHGMPKASWADTVVSFGQAMWAAHERGQMRYQVTTRRLQDAVTLMNESLVSDVREALKLAVLAAIDSPVEYRAAEAVLRETVGGVR